MDRRLERRAPSGRISQHESQRLAHRIRLRDKPESVPMSSAKPWIYGPALDVIVGCGAWSAPLLLLAAIVGASNSHAWGVAFYLLAVVFNYPHFMATVYRAYHTREDFA